MGQQLSDIARLMEQGGQIQADALLRQGQARAQGAANQGQIWGGTLREIGQSIAGFPEQQARMRAQQQEGQIRDQQLQMGQMQLTQAQRQQHAQDVLGKAMSTSLNPDGSPNFDLLRQAVLSDPASAAQWPTIQAELQKSQKASADYLDAMQERQREHITRIGYAADAMPTPEGKAALLLVQLAQGAKTGSIPLDDAHGLTAQILSDAGTPDPKNVESVIQRMKGFSAKEQKTREEAAATAALANKRDTPQPIKLTPGETLIDPDTHEPIYTAPPRTPERPPAQAGSFEDYVKRTYGENPTSEQILKARKDYQQADDRPRVDVRVAGGGADKLTPEAVEDTATRYRILGTSAIPTRIDATERVRIMNEAAKQQRALGQTAAMAVQKQAAFKSDAASLTQIQKMASSAEAFETKALAQADLIGDLSKKVPRSQYPLINGAFLSGKKAFGDQNTQLLFNALDTFTSEYAKIMNGATGSAGASSDATTRKAEGLISASLNKGTLQATLNQMTWEMAQTRKGYAETLAHITERMGGSAPPDTNAAPPPTPKGRYNPATGKVEPL